MAKRKGVYARDIDKLNIIFAAVAIASFLSVVWMIWDDYSREWKLYQRQFQVVEQEVTQQQLANGPTPASPPFRYAPTIPKNAGRLTSRPIHR